jgi:hypothetical protein
MRKEMAERLLCNVAWSACAPTRTGPKVAGGIISQSTEYLYHIRQRPYRRCSAKRGHKDRAVMHRSRRSEGRRLDEKPEHTDERLQQGTGTETRAGWYNQSPIHGLSPGGGKDRDRIIRALRAGVPSSMAAGEPQD